MKLFYSWQSDIKKQRNSIEKSLSKAIKRINRDIQIEIALDRDTKGTTGSTDIADEILRKINSASIFIADITIVNNSIINRFLKKEKYPNPNVLIELGYAVRKIGWDRIIMLHNNKYSKIEELPFDLRHRRILSFSDVTDELEKDLYSAIKIITNKESSIIPNKDAEESHDIKVFDRIMIEVPEDNLENILSIIANTGYYEYKNTRFIIYVDDEMNKPKNQFLNTKIQKSKISFGEALSNLSVFMNLNFSPDSRNDEMAKMNRFESISDYSEQERLLSNLYDELGKNIRNVLESYSTFRLSVKKHLCI